MALNFCTNCGTKIDVITNFCPTCGSQLAENVTAQKSATISPPKKPVNKKVRCLLSCRSFWHSLSDPWPRF
ncbi:zinc-ribbon domain-containing protein [Cohnella yongneupensis]|uniref:Zinc-ribbon domain-containing protein n=1 Tax=Cohnella yongneupensis TaxID=425006 RepID=A0ABW0R6A9_9BACL